MSTAVVEPRKPADFLARQRPRFSSAHFSLTDGAMAPGCSRFVLIQAVPKRLLKRAVDRNTLRRVARESWRARLGQLSLGMSSATCTNTAGPQALVMMKLRRTEAQWPTLTQRHRKQIWRAELDQLFGRWPGRP